MPEPPAQLSDHLKFTSLYRYYAWSTVLRDQFQSPFKDIIKSENKEVAILEWMGPAGIGKGAVFMSYWYAALFVVIEGWQELGYSDPVIDELIASPYTARLKRHRNATCHYQKPVFVAKWNEFEKEPGSVEWLRKLAREFGRHFTQRTRAKMEEFLESKARQEAQAIAEDPAKFKAAEAELQTAIDGKETKLVRYFWRTVLDRDTQA